MRKQTAIGAALLATCLGFDFAIGVSVNAQAAEDKEVSDAIVKIAAAIKKGDKLDARKQAEALAKKIEDVGDVMDVLKPRTKKGIGIGKKPGAIEPDAIERMLLELEQKGIGAAKLAQHAEALEDMSYIVAAVAEVTALKTPKKMAQNWKQWTEKTRAGALELAKAAKAKDAAELKSVATKMNGTCNSCHKDFR